MTEEEFVDHCAVRFLENLDPSGRDHFMGLLNEAARQRLGLAAAFNRTKQRDDLIRWLARHEKPNATYLTAANDLAAKLSAYQSVGWLRHKAHGTRPLNDPDRSLHRVLELNDGKALSARSIRRLLS